MGGNVIMLKCPYEDCKSKQITALYYREAYQAGELICLTYECKCRDCNRDFAHSKNLGVDI